MAKLVDTTDLKSVSELSVGSSLSADTKVKTYDVTGFSRVLCQQDLRKAARMATAHLIHGYLGSGKTTFAKALEEETGALRFTHDEWMKKLYGDDPAEEHFADYANRVSEVMEGLWTRCLQIGADVILDSGFWSRNERDRARLILASLGADCRLYRLSCSEDEAWKRIETRNLSLDSSLYIARNTFEVLKARFEPLSDDENRIEMSQKS